MAEAVVGGAFLSSFLNVVFERLSSPDVTDCVRGKKLDHNLLQRLEATLNVVQAVLNDAEQRQIKDPSVKKWLDDLKDAVYVADDLLDYVSTKAATQNDEAGQGNFFSRFLNMQDRDMVNKMEDIVGRLEYIVKHKDILGLKEVAMENLSWRSPSTSLVGGSMYGRENDQGAIVKLLLDDETEGKISAIPIVGMGGVGKTTLAQSVYNDDNLTKKFDLKVWVCVSEEFDVFKVTKTVIEATTPHPCNIRDLNLLQVELKEKLSGRKFFVVLDDVWNHDYDSWSTLLKPFQYGLKGSKILITTRSEKVASVVQTCPPYHLSQLSDEDCWLVFANHACFPACNGDSTLERIGKEIAKKCKGLPLAAQSLGGLLRAKHDVKDWNTILTSEIWEFSINDSKVIPALRISYYHLPTHLKRCFVYCSLFPKDYRFDKYELILLWMAEDLLEQPKRGKTIEEVGCECFDDLASRLFFKQFSKKHKSFVIHDLMHDLAISVSGEFYFRAEELGKAGEMSIKTRHLSFRSLNHPISKNLDVVGKAKSLSTFLPINFSMNECSTESIEFIIPVKFKYLRVLSFHSFGELDILPHSVCELILLRYLDLSRTNIKTLPESLSDLYNLQTLKLRDCDNLTLLPSGMKKLVNLQHLDISGTILKEMPKGMSKLKHLQLLSDFVVGRHEENGIKELGELSNIHDSLCIRKLENVTNSGQALEASIMDKTHINKLSLEWSSGDMVSTSHIEREILEKLQPHKGLKVLTINSYRGTRFPDWVAHSSYHSLNHLSIFSCSNCCMLPSLGLLPSLKSLSIENLSGLETIGAEFYKNDDDHSSWKTPFPSLEILQFHKMSSWQEWHSTMPNAFPQLRYLTISDCPRVVGELPHHLPTLTSLHIKKCEQLVFPLPVTIPICKLIIYESNKVGLQELPPLLKSLSIHGCEIVESMFRAMVISHPACLEYLEISSCSSVISFPRDCLPRSLVTLDIGECRKLEFPKQPHELLESLEIYDSCDSLTSFPLDNFPNLKNLTFEKCAKLESLSMSQSHDAALKYLKISGCLKFVSFPEVGLSAPNMTSFQISECYNLKSLPCHMDTLLPKLQNLSISNCPEMDSFPEGGLPPNLRSLSISNCEKLVRRQAWMQEHKGSLIVLSISGPCESVKSFPNEDLLPLPASLVHLKLYKLSSLETLDCKGLIHLTSLKCLMIRNCPKLENMVGEKLPASLRKLEIYRSAALLEERCKMKHPQIWPKICHIPGIQINGRWIS